MIYKKKYVLYADIKLSEEQEYRMQLITDKYAPKVMEYLKKLPDELIILGMMEWSILEQVIEKAKPRHIIPTGIVEEKK